MQKAFMEFIQCILSLRTLFSTSQNLARRWFQDFSLQKILSENEAHCSIHLTNLFLQFSFSIKMCEKRVKRTIFSHISSEIAHDYQSYAIESYHEARNLSQFLGKKFLFFPIECLWNFIFYDE